MLQEKRFDVAAPVIRGLFCGEQIQNVTVHKLKCLTAASGDTGQWILSDKGWQTCLIGDALVEISEERAAARRGRRRRWGRGHALRRVSDAEQVTLVPDDRHRKLNTT